MQMINGDGKGVSSKHVYFDYIKSSEKGCNSNCVLWLPNKKFVMKEIDWL